MTDEISNEANSSHMNSIKQFLVSKGLPDTYKDTYFVRRINVRLRKTKSKDLIDYYNYLRVNKSEVEALRKDLSINVTKFFRDIKSFTAFCDVLTEVMKNHFESNNRKPLRIWSAGCAIGAEPYSIAIHIDKMINKHNLRGLNVRIHATDFNEELLSYARRGVYEDIVLENVSSTDLHQYFELMHSYERELDDHTIKHYRISYKAKKYVDFSHFDLTNDRYPYKDLDVLICRNVLIYFTPDSQFTIFQKYYDSLKTDGILFIGNSETMHLSYRGHFENLSPKDRIYKKIDPMIVAKNNENLIQCEECRFTFTRDLDYRIHKKKHDKDRQKLIQTKEFKHKGKLIYCEFCDKSFITENRHKAHLKFFHVKEQQEKRVKDFKT